MPPHPRTTVRERALVWWNGVHKRMVPARGACGAVRCGAVRNVTTAVCWIGMTRRDWRDCSRIGRAPVCPSGSLRMTKRQSSRARCTPLGRAGRIGARG